MLSLKAGMEKQWIREESNIERKQAKAERGRQPEGMLGQLPDAAIVRHPECGNDLLTPKSVQDSISSPLQILETPAVF